MKYQLLHSLSVGIILYVIGVSCANLSFLDLSAQLFTLSLSGAFLLIGFLTVMILLYRKPDFMKKILRAIMLQLGFWGSFLVDSLIGITRFFIPMDSENLAWGLILLSFWTVLSAFSVFTILGAAIAKTISKIHNK